MDFQDWRPRATHGFPRHPSGARGAPWVVPWTHTRSPDVMRRNAGWPTPPPHTPEGPKKPSGHTHGARGSIGPEGSVGLGSLKFRSFQAPLRLQLKLLKNQIRIHHILDPPCQCGRVRITSAHYWARGAACVKFGGPTDSRVKPIGRHGEFAPHGPKGPFVCRWDGTVAKNHQPS